MLPPFFVLLQWLRFKRAIRVTRNVVSSSTKKRAMVVKRKVVVAKNKAKKAKKAVSRAAKDGVLFLPGVSKIRLAEPPFPHLLQSNKIPSPTETIVILNLIPLVEAQSFFLEDIILEHGPDRMVKHQLDRTRRFIHAHRGVLSAVRRVPPEILREIFIQTVPPWTHSRWNNDTPWALAQVCQSWRTTALSVPSLWNKLPTIYLRKQISRPYVAQIKELLVRSRGTPINFYLYAPFKEVKAHPIIDILVLHSKQWQTVIIESTNSTIFAFTKVKGRLPSLRALSLEVWRQSPDPIVLDMFEDAPQLREVHLDGPFPGEVRLPFSQLTRYKERVRGRGMADHTISLSTSLTTLEISRYPESPLIPVITLPSLVTLKVQFDDLLPGGFLDNLTLPAIQEIWIAGYIGHLITVLIALISRSQSPSTLKKLAFRSTEMDSGDLTTLLRLTPYLVDLNIPLPPSEGLSDLTLLGPNNQHLLVPLLQTLTFEADVSIRSTRRPETSQLLNALADSRCNRRDHGDPKPENGDQQQITLLKELRIAFRTSHTCRYELRFLEYWLPSEESVQLETWKDKLLHELPELEGQQVSRKRRFDWRWCDRVFHILSAIEKVQIKNVNDIYISEIHTTLRRLTNQKLSGSNILLFQDRAHEILDKWTLLFESHVQDRRWVLKGECSLVYVSNEDALRTSSSGMSVIFGIKDNLRFPELFWPIYMLY